MTPFGVTHVGIVVPDLEAAARLFAERFGAVAGPVLENAAQRVRLVQLDFGNVLLELLSPLDDTSPVAAFLTRNPRGGLHHIGLGTGDLDGALDGMRSAGVRPLGSPSVNVFGRRMAFLHPGDLHGVLVELEQR